MTSILPLTLENVLVSRRGKRLLGPIDHSISGGGITIVIGPNGSGKTTLLRAMHGVQRLAEGSISWAQPQEIAEKKQSFVFQSPIMIRRTVLQNLTFPLELIGTPKVVARKLAAAWAERIGLGGKLEQHAPRLSGGEKQKLALARALIREPEVLFLDEPCANLDGRATREIEQILLETMSVGTRVVMSTHDMGQARRLADDVIFMLGGEIHEAGSAGEILDSPKQVQTERFLHGDIVE